MRYALTAASLLFLAACIRVTVTIGGKDATTRQAVDVEQSAKVSTTTKEDAQ